MDKNTIIGILLIVGILIIFGVLNKPSEEQEAMQRRHDSLVELQKQQMEEQKIAEMIRDSLERVKTVIPDTIQKQELKNQYGSFASSATGDLKLYTIENDLILLNISNKGGRPYSVELKNYKTYDGKPVILFNGDSSIFGLEFFAQNLPTSTSNLYFVPIKNNINDDSIQLTMRLYADSSSYIDYVYSLSEGSYMMDFDIQFQGMDDIIAQNVNFIDLSWEIYVPRQEKGPKNENIYTTIYYQHFDGDVEFFRSRGTKELTEEDFPTKMKWVAFKQQFFSSIIIANESFTNANIKSQLIPEPNIKYLKIFSTELGLPYEPLPIKNYNFQLYFGPNHFNTLKKFKGLELQNLAFQGKNITRWINQFVIIPIFNWLDNFIGNYGIIILVLTIIIKIGLLPLTYRSYISQAKMRVLKPQIEELSKKFPKGKEMEKQQATMALYKKVGVSPMGGCLPMLLQMPILFAMFRFFPTSIELRQESFLWATDLSTYDAIVEWDPEFWPFLTRSFGSHLSLFTLLMTITTIISMKISNQATSTGTQMPGMKGMMYVMPVMFMFILNRFSAALTYYYFLTNVITFGQNLLFKHFVNDEEILRKLNDKKSKKPQKKKSSWQKRLEDSAKKRGYRPPKR